MKIDQMFVLSNYRKSLARHDVWCETFLHTETQRRNETLDKELCELEETLEGANIEWTRSAKPSSDSPKSAVS